MPQWQLIFPSEMKRLFSHECYALIEETFTAQAVRQRMAEASP
jgi:hypothetical protein